MKKKKAAAFARLCIKKGLETDLGRYCYHNCLLYIEVNRLLRVTLIIDGAEFYS